MRKMQIQTISFLRGKDGQYETGVIVNEGDGPIIDMDGKIVKPPVWLWHPVNDQLMTVTERER